MKPKTETPVEVACAGCGRTQRVRPSRITPCDGYTCALGGCKQNPDFKLPAIPEGWIRVLEVGAAGGFPGWRTRPATQAERQSVARAKAIRDAATRQRLRAN
ncbi:MAG: hypothetical protein AB1449_08720 [Chloroflexota bacterium]